MRKTSTNFSSIDDHSNTEKRALRRSFTGTVVMLGFMLVAMLSPCLTHASVTVVIVPTEVLASSEFAETTGATNLIDGSGLIASGAPGEEDDIHATINDASTMWLSAGNDTNGGEFDETLIFDLGVPKTLASVIIWNHNQRNGATDLTDLGVDTMTVSATASGTSVNDASGFTGDVTLDLTQAVFNTSTPAQTFSLNFTEVRFIKFSNFVNFRTSGSFAGTVGLSEVRFVHIVQGTVISIK